MNNHYHTPVLLTEAINLLEVQPGKKYIDCTLGGGGHTQKILELGGLVLGLDCDQQAINHNEKTKQGYLQSSQLTIVKTNYTHLQETAQSHQFTQVDGILMDLGVSSFQLDQLERGFSFNQDAPLDMRMDQELAVKAADLIAALSQKELAFLFKKFGDEPKANQIAKAIIEFRKAQPLTNTDQLKKLVEKIYSNYKFNKTKIHPATKTFQALRIAINDELNGIDQTLPQTLDLLKTGGKLVISSCHSGEDRIVKHVIKNNHHKLKPLSAKPIQPTDLEIKNNPRSRSAKLRAAQKIS